MKTQTGNSRMKTMMMRKSLLERNLGKAEGEVTEAEEGVPGEEEGMHLLRGGQGTKQTNAASSAASQLEQLAADKSMEIRSPLPEHVLPGDLKSAAEVAEKLAEDDVKENADKTGEAATTQEEDVSSTAAEPDLDSKPSRKRKNELGTAVKSAPKPKRAKTATPKKTKKSKKGTPKKTKAKHNEHSEDGEAHAEVEEEGANAAQTSDAQPPMVATPKKKPTRTPGRPTTPKSKAGTPKKRAAKNQEPTICDYQPAKVIYFLGQMCTCAKE